MPDEYHQRSAVARKPKTKPKARSRAKPQANEGISLIGGARVDGWSVTAPLATLTADRSCAVLQGPIIGTTRISRSEVVSLRWRNLLITHKLVIKFRTASGQVEKVTFWVFAGTGDREQLRELGWS
jgi:hypothetical protein